jgi:acylphosphatase
LTDAAAAEPVRVRVVVTGRVQGVWFRDACREQARAEAVGGWVRNRSDGAVEAEFEGMTDAVDRMVEWCRTGPPRARVDAVDVAKVPASGDRRFRVR